MYEDETQNVNRSRSSSELSYRYQYDFNNDAHAGKTPVVYQPAFRDVQAQYIYDEPTSTRSVYESEPE
jgi:hypothetical protein